MMYIVVHSEVLNSILEQFSEGLASEVAECNLAHVFLALWPGVGERVTAGQEAILEFLRGNRLQRRLGQGAMAFPLADLRRILHRLFLLHGSPKEGLNAAQMWPALARGPELFRHPQDRALLTFLQSPAVVDATTEMRHEEIRSRRQEAFGFGSDLVRDALQGRWGLNPPWIGDEMVLGRMLALLQSRAQNPLLIGESGVGKSSLVYGLAHHMAFDPEQLVPEELWGCSIFEVRTEELMAGTGRRGDLEQRIESLIQEAVRSDSVILFFDEIHTLLDSTDENARKVANALKPVLADGRLRCIGATTRQEYDKFIAGDSALAGRFRVIDISEPNDATVISILEASETRLLGEPGRRRGVRISAEARTAAIELSREFMPAERLPGKAVKILRATVAEKVYSLSVRRSEGEEVNPELSRRDVALAIRNFCGLPVDHILDPTGNTRFEQMRDALRSKVVGQDHVVEGVVGQVKMHARGWSEPGRPVGVFLFLGSPGVGKSELAKLLAGQIAGREDTLIVKDMNAYQGEQGRSMLIGSGAGYVGYGDTTLFSLVRTRPNSVLLLDEIEKARDCFPILLSMFTGSAEDARHLRTDFSKAVIVMTSNALRDQWGQSGLSDSELRTALADQTDFPPEWVDRIDRIFMFSLLSDEDLAKVLQLRIRAREARSRQPLPGNPGSLENTRRIVEEARQSGDASGRGIIRALNAFLHRQL